MLTPRQSKSCPLMRMEILKPNINHVKRNVARKSTSNRPLKNSTNTLVRKIDKTDSVLSYARSQKTCFKSNPVEYVKYKVINSKEDNSLDSVESPRNNITQSCLSHKSPSPVHLETHVYHDESEEEDDNIEGVFSISQGLVPFLSESNLSPPYLSDSADESLDSLKILNYPINADFSGVIFKDVPYYSNKLSSSDSSDNLDCNKSELVKSNTNTAVDNDLKSVTTNEGIKLVNNAVPDNNISEDILDIPEKRLGGVSVREDFVICEDRPMKMTVIERRDDFDIGKFDNVTDDINDAVDDVNDETDFPKVVCAVSLDPGSEFDFEDIVPQHVSEENQNTVSNDKPLPKKRKPRKRKASSNLFFGSRSKKKTKRSCKSKLENTNPNPVKELHSSQELETVVNDELLHSEFNVPENSDKVLNVQESIENVLNVQENSGKILIKTEVQYEEVSDNFIDSIEEGHEVIEPTDSTSPNLTVENISNNSDETVLVNSTLIKSEIISADEYEESIEAKNSIDSDSPLENSNPKEKPIETKKKNAASCDKKSKKEINEGVLLHVEAAKETEIMRDGKLLKDKKELLKDIESKIEKNLPVEVKDFDIQQSLTEEILLEQALRLAHQRTSPRRRPLLSKSETKAILNCLSNQTRYKTRRSNDKKSDPDNTSIEDKAKAELNVSTDNSDSEVKKANPVTSDESIAKPRTVTRKKKATKKVSTSKKKTNTCEEPTAETKNTSNPEHPSELDEKILAQTFENVLQEFQISSTSGEIFLKEEKQQKGANRRKKSNKKSKNKKKTLVQSDSELPESDAYYESAISQDSFHDDNSASGNEECKNKRIPVIIIKNKKVTIADHKNKKGRQTNNLFSIIKNRESNEISNHEKETNNNKEQLEKSKPEVSSSSGDSLVIHNSTDTVLSKSENIPTDSKVLEITLNSTDSQKTSDNLENSSDSSKTYIESESQKSGVIKKDLVCDPEQFKDESQNNNKVMPLNTTNSSEPEATVLKIDPINRCNLTPDKSRSRESSLPKSGIIKNKYNEDIVEVIDMDIVDVDSPKPNAADSNSSQDRIEENLVSNVDSNKSPEIPFLETSNSSFTACADDLLPPGIGITIINKSEDKSSDLPITSEEKIGFPIPTISEINAKYSSSSKSSFHLHTSPVKSNSSFQSPLPNISSRFTGPPPPLPINVNSGFSSLQSSITSVTGMHSSSMSGFTTSMPQESITPLNSPFYPPFSLAASTSVSPFNNSSYQPSMISVSATTLTSSHLYSGTYLQNTLISTSDVHSYHPPLISSGLSNAIQIPPVLPSPVVQNSPLGIPAISTASLLGNTQFPNYSYPPPGHNADSSLSSFPYPPPSNPPISIESNYPLPPNKTNYPPPPSEPKIPLPPDEPKCPPPPDEPQYPPPPDEPQCPPLPDEPNYPPPPDEPKDPISSDKPTYPSPSKDTSSSELKNDAKPSPVINEVQESNSEKITQSKSTTNSEEKLQEKSLTSSPVPTPEPEKPNIANLPKIADIPLSIAARDPRLRNRGLRLVIDSGVISLASAVKCENKPNTQPQNDSKGIEKTENVQPMEQKSADDSNPRLKDVEEAEVKNLTESDNEFSKKKAKKKEIDEELLYKTPLSDLHDAPERTSYSRTITRKPPRAEPRRDPRIFQRTELPHSHFQRDANGEVPLHHHERPEPHWDYPQEYSQPSGYPSNEDGFIPESHPPHDMHIPDPRRVECYDQRNEHCANDPRSGYHSRWRHDEFTQENKRAREYPERRPLLEASSDYRRPNYRHRETYSEDHTRFQGYSQDSRHQNHAEYRRRDADESAYTRWDYAHKRVEGSFPPEVTELKNSYSSKVPDEDRPKKELWEDENEVRDIIDGPMSSASRPFYRRKHFTKTWMPAHLRDDDGSSSPYSDDLFERRRDLETRRDDSYNDRTWDRSRNHKCDDEVINGVDRDSREDRRHHRSSGSRRERSRSPRRDYEMYEKKRSRSPRRRGRSRRGSLSPRNSPLESPMSPEPEEILYTAPTKYLPIPQ